LLTTIAHALAIGNIPINIASRGHQQVGNADAASMPPAAVAALGELLARETHHQDAVGGGDADAMSAPVNAGTLTSCP